MLPRCPETVEVQTTTSVHPFATLAIRPPALRRGLLHSGKRVCVRTSTPLHPVTVAVPTCADRVATERRHRLVMRKPVFNRCMAQDVRRNHVLKLCIRVDGRASTCLPLIMGHRRTTLHSARRVDGGCAPCSVAFAVGRWRLVPGESPFLSPVKAVFAAYAGCATYTPRRHAWAAGLPPAHTARSRAPGSPLSKRSSLHGPTAPGSQACRRSGPRRALPCAVRQRHGAQGGAHADRAGASAPRAQTRTEGRPRTEGSAFRRR